MIKFDVAIIGAGITGCLAAQRLAAKGARVALLDAGPDPSDTTFFKQPPKKRERQKIQSQLPHYSEKTAQFFVDDVDHPYTFPDDAPFLWFRGRQVGGRLHVWDGSCVRLSEAQVTRQNQDGS